MSKPNTALPAPSGCQQTLRVETPYWHEKPECGKKATYMWKSDLRGMLRVCTRHAKAVGLQHCKEIKKSGAQNAKG